MSRDNDIAIIGMSGSFTGAPDLESFWSQLCAGADCLRHGPAPSEEPGGARQVHVGSGLEQPDWFDASFFEIAAREAPWIDPQQRLLLEHAWQALEHAGHDAAQYPGRVGVFAGASGSTYFLELAEAYQRASALDQLQMMFGNSPAYLTTRVSYKLGLTGPSYAVSTACSSSLVAVHVACQSLLALECDLALAGGVAIQSPERTGYRYEPGGVVSPDGYCRTFDAEANGTVFSDGVGLVVLRRLGEALGDGDLIWAVIKGTAVNNDGDAKAGFAAPSVRGQRAVVAEALANAGVEPDSIGYLEAHGTATPLGDSVELRALREIFPAADRRGQRCAVGSVKANIGHADAASGVAGLIKTALCLKHRRLVPQIHYRRSNPELQLEGSAFYVNDSLRVWPEAQAPRRAGVSSFGVGGTNAHLVLEEAPEQVPAPAARSWHVWPLSARTPTGLRARSEDLRRALERGELGSAADVAYTLQTGRRAFEHRAALLCRSVREGALLLEELGRSPAEQHRVPATHRPLVFLFGSGGEDWPDCAELYAAEPGFRSRLDDCVAALAACDGRRPEAILPQILDQGAARPEDRVVRCLVLEHCLAKLLAEWGVRPAASFARRGSARPPFGPGAPWTDRLQVPLVADTEVALGAMDRPLVVELAGRIRVEDRAGSRRASPPTAHEQQGLAFQLAEVVRRLWLAGVSPDWRAHQPDRQRRRLLLPRYPFERRSHRIARALPATSAGSAGVAPAPVGATAGVAPAPVRRPELSTPYLAPRTELERRLAAIWGQFLGVQDLGLDDDFFELGGDSISAAHILAEIQREYGVDVPLETMFQRPTLAVLAEVVQRAGPGGQAGPVPAPATLSEALTRAESAGGAPPDPRS